MAQNAQTKNVTFRFDEEDFVVQFTFESKDGKLTATSSSLRFLLFLKDLNLVSPLEDNNSWFRNCDTLSITSFSHNKLSLMLRKKAAICGLKVIPGEIFQKRMQSAYNKIRNCSK